MDERAGGGGALEGTGRAEARLLQFDEFRVDPVARLLWRAGEPVALTPKAFSLLLVLLERPGEVVSKDELFRRVWERGTASEANLTQCISTLRKALGESASERRYVVTVPGKGYCFGAPVSQVVPSEAAAPAAPIRAPRWRRRLLEAFAILLVCVALAAWVLLARTPDEPGPEGRPAVAVLAFHNLSGREEEWLAATLPEMLAGELAAAERLRVVSDSTAVGSGDRSADLVVTGSFLALGEKPRKIRLDLRVTQARTGETVVALAEVGNEERLSELVERAAARLMEEMDVVSVRGGLPPAH